MRSSYAGDKQDGGDSAEDYVNQSEYEMDIDYEDLIKMSENAHA